MQPVVALSHSANATGTLVSGGSWHRSDTELYSPVFSPNGNEIALVAKRHMPDGEEAESMTAAELKRREARVDRDPRTPGPPGTCRAVLRCRS
jgi:predicted amidohydrolase